jgi:hypothetical protein
MKLPQRFTPFLLQVMHHAPARKGTMAWRPTWPEYGATVKNDMTKITPCSSGA